MSASPAGTQSWVIVNDATMGHFLQLASKASCWIGELLAVTKSESSSGQKGAIHVAFLFFERSCRVEPNEGRLLVIIECSSVTHPSKVPTQNTWATSYSSLQKPAAGLGSS